MLLRLESNALDLVEQCSIWYGAVLYRGMELCSVWYEAVLYIGAPSHLSSVANEGLAPLCGAAAIPMAALKTPVAP